MSRQQFDETTALVRALQQEVERVIIGQRQVLREVLVCLLAGGHVLLCGVTGLARTLLIKTLAEAVDLKFRRIQFTPELKTSDNHGTDMIVTYFTTGLQ